MALPLFVVFEKTKGVKMIPLFSTDQVRQADKYAITKLGLQGIVLMENASRSVFHEILKYFPELAPGMKVGVLAGKGNNGGDAFALSRHLINYGFDVTVVLVANEKDLKGDAAFNFQVLKKLTAKVQNGRIVKFTSPSVLNKIANSVLIVDGLLGTGAKGALREPHRSILKKVNSFEAIKVAIDSPTGLDLHNAVADEDTFRADLTVTFAQLKTGLFYEGGYKFAGKVVKGTIGIGDEFFDQLEVGEYLIEPEDAFLGMPERAIDDHKYSAGKVLVIAGSSEVPGAAIYTTNAAIYSGAGAVYLAVPRNAKTVAQTNINSAIVSAYHGTDEDFLSAKAIDELQEKIEWADVVALGPALGRSEAITEAVVHLLKKYSRKNFVIDADAIFALTRYGYKRVNLQNKVLTPHHGEFAQLLGISTQELKQNLLNVARKFVAETKSYLVLKGAPTIILNPRGEAFINTVGNAGMAKFGTGDVLTGVAASFIAQNKKIEDSLFSAVYLHSLDADLLVDKVSELGVTAEDLILNFPSTIQFLNETFLRSAEEE